MYALVVILYSEMYVVYVFLKKNYIKDVAYMVVFMTKPDFRK